MHAHQNLSLVFPAIQEMKDRLKADRSTFRWKFISSMEALEGKVVHLDMVTLRSQQKAFVVHGAVLSGVMCNDTGVLLHR